MPGEKLKCPRCDQKVGCVHGYANYGIFCHKCERKDTYKCKNCEWKPVSYKTLFNHGGQCSKCKNTEGKSDSVTLKTKGEIVKFQREHKMPAEEKKEQGKKIRKEEKSLIIPPDQIEEDSPSISETREWQTAMSKMQLMIRKSQEKESSKQDLMLQKQDSNSQKQDLIFQNQVDILTKVDRVVKLLSIRKEVEGSTSNP
jgi:hypothetical protein